MLEDVTFGFGLARSISLACVIPAVIDVIPELITLNGLKGEDKKKSKDMDHGRQWLALAIDRHWQDCNCNNTRSFDDLMEFRVTVYRIYGHHIRKT